VHLAAARPIHSTVKVKLTLKFPSRKFPSEPSEKSFDFRLRQTVLLPALAEKWKISEHQFNKKLFLPENILGTSRRLWCNFLIASSSSSLYLRAFDRFDVTTEYVAAKIWVFRAGNVERSSAKMNSRCRPIFRVRNRVVLQCNWMREVKWRSQKIVLKPWKEFCDQKIFACQITLQTRHFDGEIVC